MGIQFWIPLLWRTITNKSGLRPDPWWTPTCTLNSPLHSWLSLTLLTAQLCMALMSHSSTPNFLRGHRVTGWWPLSKASSRSMKAKYNDLLLAKYFPCNYLTRKMVSVVNLPGTWSFVELLLNCNPHIITKGVGILRLRCSDVRGELVADFIWQLWLASLSHERAESCCQT